MKLTVHNMSCNYCGYLSVCRYYEVELLTGGMMRIGWATPTFPAGIPLGSDDKSYAYDGYLVSAK